MIRIEAKFPKAPANGNWEAWGKKSRIAVAEARAKVADGELYFLCRHGGYFRPHARGYTENVAHAGLFTSDVAQKYLDVEGLSVIPFSSIRDRIEEDLKRIEADAAALRALIQDPTQAVSNPQ